MKKFVLTFIILATAAFSFSQVASAQSNTVEAKVDPDAKFYNFDDILIDGEFVLIGCMINDERPIRRFRRNSQLEKSFMSQIQDSAQE